MIREWWIRFLREGGRERERERERKRMVLLCPGVEGLMISSREWLLKVGVLDLRFMRWEGGMYGGLIMG